MVKGSLPPNTPLDDVIVRIKESYRNPNVGKINQVVLKEGPRTFRIATLFEIINPDTGAFHHFSLKIDHIDKKKHGWFGKPERSTSLEGKNPDEIERLYRFLQALYEGKLVGDDSELHIIRSTDYEMLENIIGEIPNLADSDKLQLIKAVISKIQQSNLNIVEFVEVFKDSNSETLRNVAVASRFVEYSKAYQVLESLINNSSTQERDIQAHLQSNPWMFGSEYSELVPKHIWTRDDKFDYMLRRTVDDYLEIVEIKTPFAESLFIHDDSRDSYYPSAKLSPVIGQVMRYIEEVERHRDTIIAKDKEDPLKIKALAILGRDGPPEQQKALHNLNAHLNRIEIITFDQLLKIAARVIDIFKPEETEPEEYPDNDYFDAPF